MSSRERERERVKGVFFLLQTGQVEFCFFLLFSSDAKVFQDLKKQSGVGEVTSLSCGDDTTRYPVDETFTTSSVHRSLLFLYFFI